MPQIINTNIASLNAQRNLNKSQSANQTALQRLSSGLRINSAKDDAAGLAISTRFNSQIRGLNVAVRNAGDGISLAQTAEGALGTMNDNLQRVRELAVQSANATNSDVDREALQAEVAQLVAEVSRTADETAFNGRKLLDGSFNATFQIGANAGQTLDVSIRELTASKLGASDASGVSSQGNSNALGNGDLIINDIAVPPSKADDDTASTNDAASSAIAKAAAINSVYDQTGVKAEVNDNVAAGSEMVGANNNGSVTLNGVTIDIGTTTATDGTRAAVAQAINAVSDQTGIRAVDAGSDSNGVQLIAEDGRNIEISYSTITAEQTGLAAAGTYYGGFTLLADGDVSEIRISGGDGTGNGDLKNSGLLKGTYDPGSAQVASTVKTVDDGASFSVPSGTSGLQLSTLQAQSSEGVIAFGTSESLTIVTNDGQSASIAANATGDMGAKEIAAAIDGLNGVSASAATSVRVDANGADGFVGTGGNFSIYDSSSTGTALFQLALTSTTNFEDLASAINAGGGTSGLTATYVGTEGAGTAGSVIITDVDGDTLFIQMTAGNALDIVSLDASGASTASITTVNNASTGTVVTGYLKDLDVTDDSVTSVTVSSDLYANYGDVSAGSISTGSVFGFTGSTSGAELNSVTMDLAQEPVRGLDEGDILINGVSIGKADPASDTASATKGSDNSTIQTSLKGRSAIAIAAAINKVSDESGVTASVNETVVVGSTDSATLEANRSAAVTAGFEAGESGKLYINGVDLGVVSIVDDGTGSVDFDATRTSTIDLINNASGQTGVTAEDNGVSITLTAADGRNISVAIDNDAANNGVTKGTSGFGAIIGLDSSIAGIGEGDIGTATNSNNIGDRGDTTEGATYQTTYSTVVLNSAKEIDISAGTKGNDELAELGFTIGGFGGGQNGQFLTEIDISTFEGATAALTAIDNAIGAIASQRADLGAIQNRMESTVANLAVTSENLSAANSRIQDADFAAETAELSRTQVLQQAGISILAQANQGPQQVLSLLG